MLTAVRRRAVRAPATAFVLATALVLGGCSGDPETPPPAPAASGPGSTGSASGGGRVPLDVRISTVRGLLDPKVGAEVRRDIAPVVDSWFENGFVGGRYPRSGFGSALAVFTPGARRDARRDLRLLSNKDVGAKVTAVVPVQKTVRIDVLTAKGFPVGATARVRLVFRTEGRYAKRVSVTGRLFLEHQPNGKWRVFGYDVTKAAR